jgi:hypothetical protein
MSNIYSVPFLVYERLASAKMNAFEAAINAHTHNPSLSSDGAQISFSSLLGSIAAGQIPNGIITSDMIVDGSITYLKIANNTIKVSNIDRTSIHISSDGYAVYAP